MFLDTKQLRFDNPVAILILGLLNREKGKMDFLSYEICEKSVTDNIYVLPI